MTFWKAKRLADSIAGVLFALKHIHLRLSHLELSHNLNAEALQSLGKEFGLEWNQEKKTWEKISKLEVFELTEVVDERKEG